MNDLTFKEAMLLLEQNNFPVHLEAYFDLYHEYREIYEITCRKVFGFLVFKVELYDYVNEQPFPHFYLHQISDKIDPESALSEISCDPSLKWNYAVYMFINSSCDERFASNERGIKLVGEGCDYRDPAVRELFRDDTELINEFCKVGRDASIVEKRISRELDDWFERNDLEISRIFGLFSEGELVGAVASRCFEDFKIVMPDILYVKKEFRNQGFGKRLLKALMGRYPDFAFLYQTDSKNEFSLRLANSLGFKKVGEMVRLK